MLWKPPWRRPEPDEWTQDDTRDPELREIFVRFALSVAAAFALIFGLVSFAFWWSGAAVGFGARRASGTVRNATRESIPWAVIEDDPNGKPPLYHTDAAYSGIYELVTLAEPHRIRVSARGYQDAFLAVGRAWFSWLPSGREKHDIYLQPR